MRLVVATLVVEAVDLFINLRRHITFVQKLTQRRRLVLKEAEGDAERWLIVLSAILLSGIVAGCQSPAVVSSGIVETTVPPTVAVGLTLQPVVVLTAEPASSMPSFSLATAALSTAIVPTSTSLPALAATAAAPAIATTVIDSAVTPSLLVEPEQITNAPYPGAPSPTPLPTFTPPAAPPTSPNDHYWLGRPVPTGGVVWTDKAYPYGSTRGGTLRPHHGVEFNVLSGTPVFAAAGGTIVVAGDDLTVAYGPHANFYGNLVVIQHDSSYDGQPLYTLYGHLSEVLVSVGQTVGAAEQIAFSGSSGIADGSHLHFEVRAGQNSYAGTRNPLLWLYPFRGRGVVAGRVTFADGGLAYEAPVALRRLDAPSPYSATTTYAQEQLNPDDGWQENFALDDVAAGYYEVSVRSGEETIKTEVWVYPYQTSFVEIVLE